MFVLTIYWLYHVLIYFPEGKMGLSHSVGVEEVMWFALTNENMNKEKMYTSLALKCVSVFFH